MNSILEKGKEVIRSEAEAIASLEKQLNGNFVKAVETIVASNGRVILTGMGKSGIVARKIAATMNSTGTPALFLHPSDALHGDLGVVTPDDIVICLSKSGDTEELVRLIPQLRQIGVQIIAITGNINSKLARLSDIVLDASVKTEACPHDLAPTSSTTAALVLGDALAIALLQQHNFTKEDFAFLHPAGNLGKQLLLKVETLMTRGENVPIVSNDVPLTTAIVEMTSKRLGSTCVVNSNGELKGIITDGDLRRLLQKTHDIANLTAEDVMIKDPKTIAPNILAARALTIMETYKISQLIVVDSAHKPIGMIHIHDLVEAGLRGEKSA
ncbi:MAG TPA: KpsF/GutQ family sugar-phosphate isomerase [Bacteroidota bacterium]|nr:KpsF/GutQ family sugar-phosphate isomerase [Bacteroidota bacterium]